MAVRPLRMSNMRFRVRLQKVAPELLLDPTFSEKYQTLNDSFSTEIILSGQVRYRTLNDRQAARAGDRSLTYGYITCRTSDLVTAVGDPRLLKYALITGVERVVGSFDTEEWQITEVRYRGHLPRPVITKLFFEVHLDARGSM